ncbi:hypothetical protein SUDANB150_04230 [Streptomyces sp. enrichment culture]
MSAYSSDQDLKATDATGNGVELEPNCQDLPGPYKL